MPKKITKYAQPKSVVKSGYRRVSKSELQSLGYSARSVLYTKSGVKNPTRFLTRADVGKVLKPLKEKELSQFTNFAQIKRERIKAARRKIFRHTHTVYSDFQKPVTLEQAIDLTEQFFSYLEKRYNPVWRNAIGMIYLGVDDEFSLQPRLWRDRKVLILDRLKQMLKRYKAKMRIRMIIGWIEQSK